MAKAKFEIEESFLLNGFSTINDGCPLPLVNFILSDYLADIYFPQSFRFSKFAFIYFCRFSCYSVLFAAAKLMMILGGLSWVKIIKIDRFEMAHVHWTYKYLYRPIHSDQIDLAVLQKLFSWWWCYCVDSLGICCKSWLYVSVRATLCLCVWKMMSMKIVK